VCNTASIDRVGLLVLPSSSRDDSVSGNVPVKLFVFSRKLPAEVVCEKIIQRANRFV
jgi:hypothetical protein